MAPRSSPATWLRGLGLSLAVAASLAACAGPQPRTGPELGADAAVSLRPGEHARLPDGSRLRYVGLRGDSRCPPDVTCVHAGWVELDVAHEVAGASQPLVLSTRPAAPAVHVGRWVLVLDDVGRGASPVARLRVSPTRD